MNQHQKDLEANGAPWLLFLLGVVICAMAAMLYTAAHEHDPPRDALRSTTAKPSPKTDLSPLSESQP